MKTKADTIDRIEVFPLAIPRDVPYLGPLEKGNKPNAKGYFIRPGNNSVYSVSDCCVLVKVSSKSGAVGWGECVAVVAPQVAATIIEELAGPLIIGRDPQDVVAIFEDLYNAMRVRGFWGGFYVDALSALDIAIWDLKGKLLGQPICSLLGSKRHVRMPAYISGLPKPTLKERTAYAKEWADKGFTAIKFASAVSHEGVVNEMRTLRETVGPDVNILCDMHWKYTAGEAVKLITQLEAYDLYVAEAPVAPEDLDGQAFVARSVKTPVGTGEEMRTVYEYRPRFVNRCMDVIQPEMGRTGITSFWNICQMAQAFNCRVMPHASIGIGIFQAASLQASAALQNFVIHEFQHSIFLKNLQYLTGNMTCEAGFYTLPDGPGLGVEPRQEVFQFVIKK